MTHPLNNYALEILKRNHAELSEIRSKSSVYQTFRIICPKCGSTVKISNNGPSDGTLTLDLFGFLEFTCGHCTKLNILPESLSIPVKII
jgi:hypothetical protein